MAAGRAASMNTGMAAGLVAGMAAGMAAGKLTLSYSPRFATVKVLPCSLFTEGGK
jgi:hypothetical protein